MAGCKGAAEHRKAQAKYVAKNPKAQRERVKRSEAKHPHKAKPKARKRAGGGARTGRPRKC